MKEETCNFLEFIQNKLSEDSLAGAEWNHYIDLLPKIYASDINFRLLFDWHIDLFLANGRASWRIKDINNAIVDSYEDTRFTKQISLIYQYGEKHCNKNGCHYRELIAFHARNNLKGHKLLEIGGVTPNNIIFDQLKISLYTNIESPDYIHAEDGDSYSMGSKSHRHKTTLLCNAEELTERCKESSFDSIFSVACFEHIYDLPKALNACYRVLKKGGSLYTFFAPIYSHPIEGDHGVLQNHPLLSGIPTGFHLLAKDDQRKKLVNAGINNPNEIEIYLGRVNFNRIPNRLLYEDYEKILTESPFHVLELSRQENFNLSKSHEELFKEIRSSNRPKGNLMTMGFRAHLIKI